MKKAFLLGLLAILLAAPVLGIESTQYAVQNLWWTFTLCDTIAAGDFNLWYIGADSTGATADFVEVAFFTSDQPGSLIWWNPASSVYGADTVYWHFNADERVTITAKGGIDSMKVHNTGASVSNNRLGGMRR